MDQIYLLRIFLRIHLLSGVLRAHREQIDLVANPGAGGNINRADCRI